MSENNEAIETPEENQESKYSRRFLIGLTGAAIGSFGATFFITNEVMHQQRMGSAKDALNSIASRIRPLRAMNTEKVVFEGQRVEIASAEQKALALPSGKSESSAVFVFSNDHPYEKRKTIDLFLDFGAAASRDMFLMNKSNFRDMIESSLIDLKVHPLPSSSAISVQLPNTLCEIFVTQPDKAWDVMEGLLKLSAEVEGSSSTDKIEDQIVKRVTELGVEKFDNNLISLGEFASWILSSGNHEMVKTAKTSAPFMYADGKMINLNNINANVPGDIRRVIMGENVSSH